MNFIGDGGFLKIPRPHTKGGESMIVQGLQKLTLLDYPGKVACTVFTAGCNFRCPFCHNAPLCISGSTSYLQV